MRKHQGENSDNQAGLITLSITRLQRRPMRFKKNLTMETTLKMSLMRSKKRSFRKSEETRYKSQFSERTKRGYRAI